MRITISAKCSDLFSMIGPNGTEYNGYVPDWFPGEHYGDYVELEIETKTGRIINWPKKLNDNQILETFNT